MDELPDDVLARVDLTAEGVRVLAREGLPTAALVELLRTVADAYEQRGHVN